MPWTVYAILIVFGVFVILMIINPRLSCFGRKISSPLYPLKRKRKKRQLETEDYGFSLIDDETRHGRGTERQATKDVLLGKSDRDVETKAIKTFDYGFHLGEDAKKKNGKDSDPTAGSQGR